ncbi:MAG: DNA ligase D [Bacteroidota bacterium]
MKRTNTKQAAGKATEQPADIAPMLATLVSEPIDAPGWLYEVKWDGYRALAYVSKSGVELRSRNNKSFNDKFYPVFDALSEWNTDVILDGEIVVLDKNGLADFGALQTWRSEDDGELVFYVFDVLWYDGNDLMNEPLSLRKKLLEDLLPDNGIIRMSRTFDADAKEFFRLAEQMGLEGIIAKKEGSTYAPGARSKEWLKIKTEKHQEAVIGGYTRNENSPKLFSALLLGVYEGKSFKFIGPVGTGFNTTMQRQLLAMLGPLETHKCPFSEVPEYNKPSRFRPNPPKAEVTWVKPKVVVEISYRELTSDGAIRHPSFRGLRPDKKAAEVKMELPQPMQTAVKGSAALKEKKVITAPGKKERKTLLNPTDETQVRTVTGHELKFTNLSKVFWPKEGYTKRDVINYYYQVAPYMVPYLKDRPHTLFRHPHGINGQAFYQKDVTGKAPGWIKTFPYYSEHDEREKQFLVCDGEASLLYMASQGCIEINPWSSRIQSPDNPDWCIIDLDPDKNTFDQVIQTAQVVKQLLDAIGVPSHCKTSGSSGLHIYIPFGGKYTYEDSKEFGRAIVKIVHAELPEFTSIERITSKRGGKMYLDFLQNRPQATIAAPYSLRPKPGATVSAPLHWEEVKKGLKMSDFTIKNMPARLREQGDIFKGVSAKGIDITKALKKLSTLYP